MCGPPLFKVTQSYAQGYDTAERVCKLCEDDENAVLGEDTLSLFLCCLMFLSAVPEFRWGLETETVRVDP